MRDLGGRFSLTALRLIGFGDGPGTSGFVGISHEKTAKTHQKRRKLQNGYMFS
jgi:hypothetical protein